MNEMNKNIIFDNESRVAPLGLIALEGAKDLGDKINKYLALRGKAN